MTEILEQLLKKLQSYGVHDLRQIGRAVGVKSPTVMKKEELIDIIISIAKNESQPAPRTTRGAPPKSGGYDHEIVDDVLKCRSYFASAEEKREQPAPEAGREQRERPSDYFCISSGEEPEEKVFSGILEFTEKFWFLRTQNLQISSCQDVFVHQSFITRFRLKTGDFIVCKAKRRRENECPGLTYVISVNGISPDALRRSGFESLIPCYPDSRLHLEYEGCSLTERVIDLFSPIGRGQRALIVSPPKAGKTTMLKHIAQAICRNHPQTSVIVLLIDERPEEVTDIRRSVEGAQVFFSTFDKGDNHHIHTASLALEYAKRQVEVGRDVVVLLDSITRLTRAYNAVCNSGRTLSGGLDPMAIVEPKKFFGAARNIEDGGSLTIIATALVDTGSRLDDVIYEEFKSTGNMEIVLSRGLAERRIFPAIDIKASGARKEELLLSETELETAAELRGLLGRELSEEQLFATMRKTADNAEFCMKSKTFLKIYGK